MDNLYWKSLLKSNLYKLTAPYIMIFVDRRCIDIDSALKLYGNEVAADIQTFYRHNIMRSSLIDKHILGDNPPYYEICIYNHTHRIVSCTDDNGCSTIRIDKDSMKFYISFNRFGYLWNKKEYREKAACEFSRYPIQYFRYIRCCYIDYYKNGNIRLYSAD